MTRQADVPGPRSSRGVVVSAHRAASAAGACALDAGGNAIDAAVATAWALCVCEPSGSGLGGQTVALVRIPRRVFAVNGNSYAPALVSRRSVSRPQQRRGHRATTVPTTPATLSYLQDCYGRLSRHEVLAPAIELAERGFEVSLLHHRQLRWCQSALAASAPGRSFLRNGAPFAPGEIFTQPALAECLRRLADCGIEDFYDGKIARAIDRDMRRNDGLLRLADLQALRSPAEQDPISIAYRGHLVMTMPGPCGGPQLVHALSTLARSERDMGSGKRDSWYSALAVAVRGAFEQRERDHSRRGPEGPTPVVALHGASGEQGGETTHLCAADADGNVVTLTQSIQSLFGAKVANDTYGFLYNNYLTTCPRRRHAHRLQSGCPARSNAAPTLVFGEYATAQPTPLLALGAAGSRRIISSVAHVLSAVIDLDMPVGDAVGQARIHPRLSGTVLVEKPAATSELVDWLHAHVGPTALRRNHSYTMGAVQALQLAGESRAATGFQTPIFEAAADPRREGVAARC